MFVAEVLQPEMQIGSRYLSNLVACGPQTLCHSVRFFLSTSSLHLCQELFDVCTAFWAQIADFPLKSVLLDTRTQRSNRLIRAHEPGDRRQTIRVWRSVPERTEWTNSIS